jgi:hypothetical protein
VRPSRSAPRRRRSAPPHGGRRTMAALQHVSNFAQRSSAHGSGRVGSPRRLGGHGTRGRRCTPCPLGSTPSATRRSTTCRSLRRRQMHRVRDAARPGSVRASTPDSLLILRGSAH